MKAGYLTLKLFILAAMIALISCDSEEKFIDNSLTDWQVLISYDSPNPAVALVNLPDGNIISSDIFSANNPGEQLKSPVKKIAEFFGLIYLLVPDEFKIIVIESKNFKKYHEYDFSEEQLIPSDICFLPNSTTAYVCHENSDKVTILDIYNKAFGSQISVGANPTAISCSGNQVVTINTASNSASIIDSRTNQEEVRLDIAPKPIYISFAPNGRDAVIISLGNGKMNTDEAKSPAFVSFLNLDLRQITKSIELAYQTYKSSDFVPKGLSVTPTNWSFIPSEEILIRVDVRKQDKIFLVNKNQYSWTYFNTKRKELLFLKDEGGSQKIVLSNSTTGAQISVLNLPVKAKAIYPL